MRTLLSALALVAALAAVPATAAQDDPRLDPHFERLLATPDPAEAMVVESFIWSIWMEANDDRLNQLMMLGARDMQVGDLDAAIDHFSTVIEVAPRFAEGWNKRATALYMSGRHDESIADCMAVLALEPRHFGALSGLGLIHEARGDKAAALEWYRKALAQNPHMPGIVERVDVLTLEVEGEPI